MRQLLPQGYFVVGRYSRDPSFSNAGSALRGGSVLVAAIRFRPRRARTWATAYPDLIRSAASGNWSAASTWEGGKVSGSRSASTCATGAYGRLRCRIESAARAVQVGGKLTFARDRNTLLNVGLLRIERGEKFSEEGFDCDGHFPAADGARVVPIAALEIGTAEEPIPAEHHGHDSACTSSKVWIRIPAPRLSAVRRRWISTALRFRALGQSSRNQRRRETTKVDALDSVADWRVGDRIIVSATTRQNKVKKTFQPTLRDRHADRRANHQEASTATRSRSTSRSLSTILPKATSAAKSPT